MTSDVTSVVKHQTTTIAMLLHNIILRQKLGQKRKPSLLYKAVKISPWPMSDPTTPKATVCHDDHRRAINAGDFET